ATATAFAAALKANTGFNELADYSPSAQGYPELPGLASRPLLGIDGEPNGVYELAVASYTKTGARATTKYALGGLTVLTIDTNAGARTVSVVKTIKPGTADLYLNEFNFDADFDLNGQTGPLGVISDSVDVGTTGEDDFNPAEGQLAFGLQGADSLTAGAVPSSEGVLPSMLFGGADGDTYKSVEGSFALIVDSGTSGTDVLELDWLDLSQTKAQLQSDGITGTVIDGIALRIQRTIDGVVTDGVIIAGYNAGQKSSPIEQVVGSDGALRTFKDAVGKLTLTATSTFAKEYGLTKAVVDNSLTALRSIEAGYAAAAQTLL
ncbi:MAG: hypothetical protein VKM92_09785, partial [Cyanobacteriota bacterium]|nr:hypothetical protein [Cyanobacteriota bacterium]